jgi:hypothetical protein
VIQIIPSPHPRSASSATTRRLDSAFELRLSQGTRRLEPAIGRRRRGREQLRIGWSRREPRIVELLHPRVTRELLQRIGSNLAGQHRQPAGKIAAAEVTQPAQIAFEQQQPEVAKDIVDLALGEPALLRRRVANLLSQIALVLPNELTPCARVTGEHSLEQLIVGALAVNPHRSLA